MKDKTWVEERRSIWLKEVVHQMLLAKLFFDELYHHYQQSGHVAYEKAERWIGTEASKGSLWRLKDTSHLLFRKNASGSFFYERVFDWTLGSIFHEGMKLKENVYLVEACQEEGRSLTETENIPEDVNLQGLLEEYKTILTRARDSAAEEIENIRYLFAKAMEQLQRLIRHSCDNGLLIRFLLESEGLYESVYGKGSLNYLFKSICAGGLEEAYLRIAKSYREGGWYKEALEVLNRASEMNPRNEEVKREAGEIHKIMASLG